LSNLKDGKIAKIGGDPDCPIAHGTLCTKGLASAQLAYHKDRLTILSKGLAEGERQMERIHGMKPWTRLQSES